MWSIKCTAYEAGLSMYVVQYCAVRRCSQSVLWNVLWNVSVDMWDVRCVTPLILSLCVCVCVFMEDLIAWYYRGLYHDGHKSRRPQTVTATRYTMTATAMKTWKTNGALLRNRHCWTYFTKLCLWSSQFVAVMIVVCGHHGCGHHGLWPSLSNPVLWLRRAHHSPAV